MEEMKKMGGETGDDAANEIKESTPSRLGLKDWRVLLKFTGQALWIIRVVVERIFL